MFENHLPSRRHSEWVDPVLSRGLWVHNESQASATVTAGDAAVGASDLDGFEVQPNAIEAANELDALCERVGLEGHPRVRAVAELLMKFRHVQNRLNSQPLTQRSARSLAISSRTRERLCKLFDEIHGDTNSPVQEALLADLVGRDAVFAECFATWLIDSLTGSLNDSSIARRNAVFYLHVSDEPVPLPPLCMVVDVPSLEVMLAQRLRVRGARAGIHPVAQIFDTTQPSHAPLSHWLGSVRAGGSYGDRVLRGKQANDIIPPMNAVPGVHVGTGYLLMGRVRSSVLSEDSLDATLFAGKQIAENILLKPVYEDTRPRRSSALPAQGTTELLTARAVGVVSGPSLLSLLYPSAKGCGDGFIRKVLDPNGHLRKGTSYCFVTHEVPAGGASPTSLQIYLPKKHTPYINVLLGLMQTPAHAYAAFFYEFGGGVGYSHVPMT